MALWPGQRADRSAVRRREARAGLLFVLPWLLSLLIFTAYPVLAVFYLSLTDYNVVQPPTWVGLQNYRTMLSADPAFWISVKNTASYTLLAVPLGLAGSLALALLLNLRVRGLGVYRTLVYLPALAPPVASTIIFIGLFDSEGGLINAVLQQVGLPALGWLNDPTWSKPALVMMSLWGLGAGALIFLAGLQEIPQALWEAAAIDGAGPWQRFRHITLPLLTPVVLFNLVIGVIGSFHVFTPALVSGGTTGKPLESTLMLMVHIYRNAFRYFAMGYASALAVVLFLAVLMVTWAIFRSARVWVDDVGNDRRG
ncbi:MAG TPA: sugar ABC transporter permease [Candidatus Tectomicrobia bacterium]